ncbi:MAG: zinc-binding dehydrogenase [Solirubrobacterales bacterium]|nr:zinc-binding dehydrogenase [Solirubrobacterales bacterium]
MKALMVTELSGPAGLRLLDVDQPSPDGGVLIDVAAAGVSFPDLLLTRGRYQERPEPPFAPGLEVAGTVVSAPADSGHAEGDRAAAFMPHGGYAERVAVPAHRVVAIPPEASFEVAAAMLVNYHTVLFALERRAAIRAGEVLVVLGAGGGIGTAAVQVGAALGARVLAVVRDEAGRETATRAGAEEVIDLGDGLRDRARELTGGRGADVILDPVGGELFAEAIRCLAPEGRLLVVGFAAGSIPELKVNRLLLRNASVAGVAWGAFTEVDRELVGRGAAILAPMLADGRIDPVIAACYPLAEGARALADLEGRRVRGKSVLVVGA